MKKAIPKYQVISKEIIHRIQEGEFQPGDKVPSENEIIEIYSVSNTTARKSLQEVELQGWANRIKGKGTYVLNRFEDKHLTRVLGAFHAMRENFNDKLLQEGFMPTNVLLEKTIMENGASTNVNNRQYIIEGPVLKIHRLRYADNILLKDEIKYISMKHCPGIHLLDLEKTSLINLYEEKYGLGLKNASRTLGVTIMPPSDTKNYFENDIPIAVFILNGVLFDINDKVVELEQSYYRGDKYKFTVLAIPELTHQSHSG